MKFWTSICSSSKLFSSFFPYEMNCQGEVGAASILEFEIDWKGPGLPILWRAEAKSWGSYARKSRNCAEDIRHHIRRFFSSFSQLGIEFESRPWTNNHISLANGLASWWQNGESNHFSFFFSPQLIIRVEEPSTFGINDSARRIMGCASGTQY